MAEGFVSRLYRVMRAGDTRSFRRLLRNHPKSALDGPPEGCIAPALISAVFARRADYLRELLEAGADPNLRSMGRQGSAYNLRALDAALWFESSEMVEILRQHGAEEDFASAVFARDVRRVRRLLQEEPERIGSAFIRPTFGLLHVSADLGHVGLTRLFLEKGLDPNQRDGDGHAPLRYAARNTPAIAVLRALLDAGAEIDATSRTGLTALAAACRSNESHRTVVFLLENGADPNLVPKDRNAPLLRAARLRNPKMVRALLDHGADPLHAGPKGETALSISEKKKSEAVLKLLEARLPARGRRGSDGIPPDPRKGNLREKESTSREGDFE